MKISAFEASDLGKNRKSNEDAHLVDSALGLYIVCDGSTGPGGAWMAKETIRQIQTYLTTHKTQLDSFRKEGTAIARLGAIKLLETAVQKACNFVYRSGQEDLEKRTAFTTADVLLSLGNFLLMAHVGDSRTYLVRTGKLHRLTHDHTFLQDMIHDGGYSEEDARKRPYSNNLTRALGNNAYVQLELSQVELAAGDIFVLCTDGFSDYAKPDEILECVQTFDGMGLCQTLLKISKNKGSTDNATILVLEISSSDEDSATRVVSKDAPQRARAMGGPSEEVFAKIEIIKTIPLFRHLTYPELIKVLGLVNLRHYEAGVSVVVEGAPSEEMFVVLSGGIAVSKSGEHLAQRGRGEVIGEMGIFDNAPRSATVASTEPLTMMVIHRRDLFLMMREDSVLAVKLCWGIIQELSKRIRAHSETLVERRAAVSPLADLPFLEEMKE